MPAYAELHCHSAFSFLDGASTPEELIETAAKLNLSALALTDHNGLYGVVRFSRFAKLYHLPTIFGAEITFDSTQNRNSQEDPDGTHLVILARNPGGYSELSKFLTEGQLVGSKNSPKFSFEMLSNYNLKNWLILTGCRKGPLAKALLNDGPAAAHKALHKLINIFPKDNLVIELWDHNDPIDTPRNDELALLGARENITIVAAQNVHYATPSKRYLANLLQAIRAKKTLAEMSPWLPVAGTQHLRSPLEQSVRFKKWPGAVETTVDIAQDISFDLDLVKPQLPTYQVPDGHDEKTWLVHLVNSHAPRYYGPRGAETVPGAYKQLDYELNIINELGFAGYFLIVYDITQFLKKASIAYQGRGSAANSAVCYVLGITRADPVSLGLLFERFLSLKRSGPPDIDIDIESTRREEVIQYVFQKYGRLNCAQVANVVEYKWKSALRDCARAFGIKEETISKWIKLLRSKITLNASDYSDLKIPKNILSLSKDLIGLPRHLGVHTGGMVITKQPISQLCPIEWATKEQRSVLQWDKDDCAQVGLVKFDLLGLKMLEVLRKTTELIEQVSKEKIELAKIPQEKAIYEMLSSADTVGIFQVESRAQMNTLPRLKPKSFYDLVIEVALIRPGPIQSGSVHPYLRRRNNQEPITYLHDLLKPALSKTLGVPIFQEQLMRIAIDAANFTADEADQLRSALSSKRSAQNLEKLKQRIISGLLSNGIAYNIAIKIYNELLAFANFGFPESHSISFAYITYASAWLKYHYTSAYLVAMINSQPLGFWSTASLTQDAKHHNIKVLPVDINLSDWQATIEEVDGFRDLKNGPVRLGLASIKNISFKKAKELVDNRPYRSLNELIIKNSLTRDELSMLARSGALCSLNNYSRSQNLWEIMIEAKNADPQRLPNFFGSQGALKSKLPHFKNENLKNLVKLDINSTGIYLCAHPIELYEKSLKSIGVSFATELTTKKHQDKVKVAGIITHRQRPETAKGAVFLNLEDHTGLINIFFSKGAWQRWHHIAGTANMIIVKGTLEEEHGAKVVVAEQVLPIYSQNEISARNFH